MADKSLLDYFSDALATPMSIKGREGATIMPMDAMTKAVVNNAVKGDLASISFLQNLTRTPDPDADRQRALDRQQAIDQARQQLTEALRADDLYTPSLDIEISQLATTLMLIGDLDRQMQQPGFQDMLTSYDRSGNVRQTINPLHDYRDRYRRQFKDEWRELRQQAQQRKMMRKR